jgi:hypothetical protein
MGFDEDHCVLVRSSASTSGGKPIEHWMPLCALRDAQEAEGSRQSYEVFGGAGWTADWRTLKEDSSSMYHVVLADAASTAVVASGDTLLLCDNDDGQKLPVKVSDLPKADHAFMVHSPLIQRPRGVHLDTTFPHMLAPGETQPTYSLRLPGGTYPVREDPTSEFAIWAACPPE